MRELLNFKNRLSSGEAVIGPFMKTGDRPLWKLPVTLALTSSFWTRSTAP